MGQALERAHGLQLVNAWPSESETAECYAAPANQNTLKKRPPFTYFSKAATMRESMQVSPSPSGSLEVWLRTMFREDSEMRQCAMVFAGVASG
jgi:hypothetical protein